ncbi:MAG: peptidylprolyl isomerase [Pseudomonadota bacterium]
MDNGCGSGSCGCKGGGTATAASTPKAVPGGYDAALVNSLTAPPPIPLVPGRASVPGPVASVNGVALHAEGEYPNEESLRQMACSELLRQAAQQAGLLAADDEPMTGGVQSEAATDAIEALLERELKVPDPSDDACARYYAAHEARYRTDEQVNARHILFAVTPGVDVVALRNRAEGVMLEVRCHDRDDAKAAATFAAAATRWSNCPSSAEGGELGWLGPQDCAPEFGRELFGLNDMGVLPRLVHSRFGFHVVEVLARKSGTPRPFETVREAVRLALRQQTWATALRQYLTILAGEASLVGVALEASDSPLVQ